MKNFKDVNKAITDRMSELLNIPEVNAVYQGMETKEAAEEYIFFQALITLMYSHEERMEMLNKKEAA